MKVYLFSDYLKTINGDPLQESQSICEVNTIYSMPNGLVRIKGKLAKVCALSGGNIYIKFMGKIPEKNEIHYSEHITCPHCGCENRDSSESPDSGYDIPCETCGSALSYWRVIAVTYSSIVVERNESVFPLI